MKKHHAINRLVVLRLGVLSRVFLRRVVLRLAVFSGAFLRRAVLRLAVLGRAVLKRVVQRSAVLRRAVSERAALGCLCSVLLVNPVGSMAATPGSVLDKLAVPANATLSIVTADALHNGAPIAMATLTSSDSVDSVLQFYRNLWNDGDDDMPGHIESAFDTQQLISRLRDGVNIVIQLEKTSGDGVTGYVSVLALNAPRVAEDHGVFSDLEKLSSNRSVDGVDTSWMRVYASSSSADQTHDSYLHRLIASGWHVLSDNEVEGAWVTQLGRDNSRLEVSFLDSREYASVVVAHQVISK